MYTRTACLILALYGNLARLAWANRTEVCVQAEATYRSACLQDVPSTGVLTSPQGRPGKRGQKGEDGIPGEDGLQGPPGIVDKGELDSLVQTKLEQVFSEYDAKIVALTSSLETANAKIKALESREGICPVKYEGKCFWLEIRYEGSGIIYNEGKAICSARGGHPANIYSEEHYGEITRYIRAQMPEGKDNFYVWLGMRVDLANRRITLTDGSPAPFLKWHEGHPEWRSDYPNMGMHVRNPPDLRFRDMYDYHPYRTRLGVLCEL